MPATSVFMVGFSRAGGPITLDVIPGGNPMKRYDLELKGVLASAAG